MTDWNRFMGSSRPLLAAYRGKLLQPYTLHSLDTEARHSQDHAMNGRVGMHLAGVATLPR